MAMPQAELLAKIREIQNDPTLSDADKAKKRQELMSGKWAAKQSSEEENKEPNKEESGRLLVGSAEAPLVLCKHHAVILCILLSWVTSHIPLDRRHQTGQQDWLWKYV